MSACKFIFIVLAPKIKFKGHFIKILTSITQLNVVQLLILL
jgi:hypothetical protein